MSSATRPRRSAATTRTRRSSAAATGRFSRAGMTPRRARRRRAAPQRRGLAGGWLQRRPAQKQSSLKRMLSGVGSAMPGRKGAGGLAMLAGAAGLAFKNRDKVAAMVRRDDGTSTGTPATTGTMAGGTTPVTGDAPKV